MKDLWGDFDLLIGAYKNNLKITEVPVTYYERKEESTKMTYKYLDQLFKKDDIFLKKYFE